MAWARVQGTCSSESSSAATTKSVTFAAPVGAGNTVCGIISYDYSGSATVTSIVDDKGNSYNVESPVDNTSDFSRNVGFSRSNVTGGPTVVTVTLSAAKGYAGIIIDEFSGGSTASSDERDGAAHGGNTQFSPSTATDAITSGSFTTSTNGDLIYGVLTNTRNNVLTISHGTGFTDASVASAVSSPPWPDYCGRSEWREQTTAGSGTAALFTTTNSGATASTTFMIAMKPAGAGPAGVSAQLLATEAADVAALRADVTAAAISAQLLATEAPDVASLRASVTHTAALGATEAPDVAALRADVVSVSAQLSATEAADTAAMRADVVSVSARLAATEAADVAALRADVVSVSARLNATEAPDTAALTAYQDGSARLNATEAADTASLRADVSVSFITAQVTATEAPDTAALQANLGVLAQLAATEAPDTAALRATVTSVSARLNATEAPDTAAIQALLALPVTARLAATEAPDVASLRANLVLPGMTAIMSVVEPPDGSRIIAQVQSDAPGVLHFGRRVTINRW